MSMLPAARETPTKAGRSREPHLWKHRSKQPRHTAHAGGFFCAPTLWCAAVTADLKAEKRALRSELIAARARLDQEERAFKTSTHYHSLLIQTNSVRFNSSNS